MFGYISFGLGVFRVYCLAVLARMSEYHHFTVLYS